MPKKEKKRDRNIRRIHKWSPGEYPRDPDAGNPNIEYTTIGKMLEEDEKNAPKPAIWTPAGGPESGMPCPNCGEMTRIVDSKTPKEIIEPFGFKGENPADGEKVVALGCPKCARIVLQMRESTLPRRRP